MQRRHCADKDIGMDRLPARLPPQQPEAQTRWYVLRLKDFGFGGPLTVTALKSAIDSGSLVWTDFAYVEAGAGSWRRLYELDSLRKFLPLLPEPVQLKKFTDRATASRALKIVPALVTSGKWADFLAPAAARVPRAEWSSPRYWFLLLDGREVGPVDLAQIEKASQVGPVSPSAYAWHVSMKRWKPFSEIPELAKYVGKTALPETTDASLVIERGTQRRRASRKSLIAAVYSVQESGSEFLGVCSDISPQGFQLLQNEKAVDYITGTRFQLEIRAAKASTLPSFQVTAVVKWFDPAKKIAGFEFEKLGSDDRKVLEKYTHHFG